MTVAVLQDHRVNNFTTKDASPSGKIFAVPVEFFVGHDPTAPLTPHIFLSFTEFYTYIAIFVPIYILCNSIKWLCAMFVFWQAKMAVYEDKIVGFCVTLRVALSFKF